jgi:hypothetical protein
MGGQRPDNTSAHTHTERERERNAYAYPRTECTQATEPAALCAVVKGSQQAVLLGDHFQLPPTVTSPRAEKGSLSRITSGARVLLSRSVCRRAGKVALRAASGLGREASPAADSVSDAPTDRGISVEGVLWRENHRRHLRRGSTGAPALHIHAHTFSVSIQKAVERPQVPKCFPWPVPNVPIAFTSATLIYSSNNFFVLVVLGLGIPVYCLIIPRRRRRGDAIERIRQPFQVQRSTGGSRHQGNKRFLHLSS